MIGQTRAMPPLTLRPDEEKLYEGQPRGFPFGEFNLEDVMLPETDSDFGVASEEEEEEEEEVGEEQSGFANVLSTFEFWEVHGAMGGA